MHVQKDEVEIIFAKGDGEVIAADVADRLRAPSSSEGEVIKKLRKAGATDDDVTAAAAAFRLLDSLGAWVSFSDAATQAVTKADDAKGTTNMGTWTAEETNRAINHYETVAKAEKPKPAAESVRELERLEKHVERKHDARSWETIEARADAIRKSDHSLTKPQAIARVLKQDPALYASYARHQDRQMGVLNDHPSEIHKTADAQDILEKAARRFRDADPSLTQAQAIAKALEHDPSLYTVGS